jgi:hypothetical protein
MMRACRAPEGARFRPYDLRIVSRQQVKSDYYTMSATGVMHVVEGCQVTAQPHLPRRCRLQQAQCHVCALRRLLRRWSSSMR